ncbi:MAG: ribosome maturation factor RimM [Caulobacteraceae bacterium]
MSNLILIAQVAGAFGVRGEVRLTAHTADPMSLLAYSPLKEETGAVALTLTGGRAVKGALIARAREIATREDALALRGLRLFVERADLPPPGEDEFYLADLIGLVARAPDGAPLGKVKSVANFGAGDLLEIDPGDGSPAWWAPFTREAAPEVNLAEGWLTVVKANES